MPCFLPRVELALFVTQHIGGADSFILPGRELKALREIDVCLYMCVICACIRHEKLIFFFNPCLMVWTKQLLCNWCKSARQWRKGKFNIIIMWTVLCVDAC